MSLIRLLLVACGLLVLSKGRAQETASCCNRHADSTIVLKNLLLPFFKEPKTLTVSVHDGYAVIDGDILLGRLEEVRRMRAHERGVVIDYTSNRWPNATIPYTIAAGFSTQYQAQIQQAIDYFSAQTNMCMVPKTAAHTDYVEFTPAGYCNSYIGRIGGMQPINLMDPNQNGGSGCYVGSIVHEICHAAGMFHEQSREDRDTYVTINWDNIATDMRSNFDTYPTMSTDIGTYDYCSLMHYGARDFSTNGQPTITPKQALPASPNVIPIVPPLTAITSIGQRQGMSAVDIATINAIYPQECGTVVNSLTLSTSSVSAPNTAGSASVTVTANVAWTATSNAAWLTVSPASGTNSGTLTLSYAANTGAARSATVTVSGGGLTRTVSVSQAAAGTTASLTLSTTSVSAPTTAGSTTVSVTANVVWTASSNVSWLTVSPASGTNNGTLTLTYAANGGAARTGTVTVTGGGLTRTVSVNQAGSGSTTGYLNLGATTLTGGGSGGTWNVGLSSNVAWTASSDATWLTVSPTSGTGNATLSLRYGANPSTSANRVAVVTVSGGGLTRTITLTQSPATAYINLGASTLSASTYAGRWNIGLSSNVAWTASSNAAWLTVSPLSGTGNATLVLNYTANSGTARTGVVTVTGGGVTRTITLNQAGRTNDPIVGNDALTPGEVSAFSATLYPNPAYDVVQVRLDEPRETDVRLLNAVGQLVRQQQGSDMVVTLDIADQPAGVYLVEIRQGTQRKVLKLVKATP